MLSTSAVLFAIAAIGGIVLARREERPMSIAIIHGLVAAIGLVLLIIGVLQGSAGTLSVTALILFIIAALGGFVLFSFHLRGRELPKGLISIHGLAAVVAEVLLIVSIL